MTVRTPPLAVTAYTAVSALGRGRAAHAAALRAGVCGLVPNAVSSAPLACWVGQVDGIEAAPLPTELAAWESRNHRIAWLALQQDGLFDAARAARERYGRDRVALLLGTSTASIGASEEAYRRLTPDGRFPPDLRRPAIHTAHSLVGFVAAALDLAGPCATVSTACSSSAKVFAQAERLIRLGLADAALVGGVDSLCDSVLFGFNALELVSPEPCRPCDVARRGLSIGEAGGFALLERVDAAPHAPRLIGYGESSDAHHMSAPHPQGLCARLALQQALARAGLSADAVDYINLHGTASQKNDEVELALVADTFPASTRASSTKGATGHTLGAAGILEATVALLALEHGIVPGTVGCRTPDPAAGPQLALASEACEVRVALSNSFGFGGNNACLAFARAEAAA